MKKDRFNIFERFLFYLFNQILNDYYYAYFSLLRWYGRAELNPPITFNEKLQWLKIYNRQEIYVTLADKYAVRDFVAQKIGRRYINELYGVWNNPKDIDFESLPSSFVLKATHGSGMNLIIKDKSQVIQNDIIIKCTGWIKTDYGKKGREWMYSRMKPKVIAEKLILDQEGNIPKDYKVFCFNGTARFISVDVDRFKNQKRCFYDRNWIKQDFTTLHSIYEGEIPKPSNLDEILHSAEALSQGITFVRVDFYLTDKLIFGEMTFFPGNCTEPFFPDKYDFEIGKYLNLDLTKTD